MLYIEDFSMRHYVGFSQIGSHFVQGQEAFYKISEFDLDSALDRMC